MSRSWLRAARLCALDGTLQRARGDRPREGHLTVDHDDRQVDAVAVLEFLVAVDRDAPELEAEPRRLALQHCQRAGAEAAARPLEEHDLDAASRRR
jgi:hypothetical protein